MSTTKTTLDEWIFPADEADEESDETEEFLGCGHPPEHADDAGQCVVCNVAGAVGEDEATKTALTRDQAAPSPFDGGAR